MNIETGMKVKTAAELEDTREMLINPRHLECRKAGITGTVKGYVPGHGGDVWWVAHDDSDDVGAYCYTELEPNDEMRDRSGSGTSKANQPIEPK